MLRRIVFAALMFAVDAPCMAEEIILIPLNLGAPELALGEDDVHLLFDADRDLSEIASLRLHVTGYYLDHRSFGGIDGNPFSFGYGNGEAGLDQGFVVGGNPECVTEHVFGNTENGGADFALDLDFDCGGPEVDWTFLAEGTGTLLLRSLDCSIPSYPFVGHCTPSAYLESATLVIQLDTLVATERQSWGSLKARYR